MALFQRIALAAGIQLVRVGDAELIPASAMQAFLDEARRFRAGILYIEAYRVGSAGLIPDARVIADYAALMADPAFVERSITEARGFLAIAGREDHLYDVAILGRNPLE
ncbi:MAG: hypothetical protein SGI72_14445 [Planctomycetota bacterium]|nr:hypothetical protein [Planctomycetota bacterium]